MKSIQLTVLTTAFLAVSVVSCRGTHAGASNIAAARTADSTFVYRDGESVRARLNAAESKALYSQMQVTPSNTRGGLVKVIRMGDEGLEIYCIKPSVSFEESSCTLSIKEALVGKTRVGGTLVQRHVSKPLLVASVYNKNLFLQLETQANLDLPEFNRNIKLDKVTISLNQKMQPPALKIVAVSMSIDVSSIHDVAAQQ